MQKACKYTLLITIFFTSCRPNTIISKKDMVSLLVKMQLIDASVLNSGLRSTHYSMDTIDYYCKTIQSYGYTQAQFDSSLAYYTKSPKEFDAIYDKVIIELSAIETKMMEENKVNTDSIAKDTLINLWKLKPSYELLSDRMKDTIDFKIPTLGLGVYTVSADVYLHSNDKSVSPSMVAYFYFDDQSKEGMKSVMTTKSYKRILESQNYSIQLELRNTLVTHLKGSIFKRDNAGKDRVHASISNIKVYYKPFTPKQIKSFRKSKRPIFKEE